MKYKVITYFDNMQDEVEIFDNKDEEINAWIENYDKELIDVKLTVDRDALYTATVIYINKSEGEL
ncbi:hypothetical protein QK901_04255 [Streptococcus thermophilus]|uniref:DUF7204 family protein n=1 Tax=Streptococcus thermophilus TaxID=1308 RepID=UPI003A801E9F